MRSAVGGSENAQRCYKEIDQIGRSVPLPVSVDEAGVLLR